MTVTDLPDVTRVLAIVAHPDDETFGLGAVLSRFVEGGSAVAILCFTRGEASTLGGSESDLASIRKREFREAAAVLGIDTAAICDYADGALDEESLEVLGSEISAHAAGVELLMVFDEGGITGHPDHERATEAAVVWARTNRVPVLAWTLPIDVAEGLNDEFDADFVGRSREAVDLELRVDRTCQIQAIKCHRSQSRGNKVLQRRLELQQDREWLRYLARE